MLLFIRRKLSQIGPVCNGRACAGQVPGMGGVGTGASFMNNVDALKNVKKQISDAATKYANISVTNLPKIAGLSNLSGDINLAARNALAAMIDYIMAEYGYDQAQAYMIASIAVDMRIGQLVDVPNVGVTAVLPLDIFVGRD